MTLGELIYEKRRFKRISRSQLGKMCGYPNDNTSTVTVSNWENDRCLVPLEKIRRVSEILEIPLDKFIPK